MSNTSHRFLSSAVFAGILISVPAVAAEMRTEPIIAARSGVVSAMNHEATTETQAKAQTGVSHVRPRKSAARNILLLVSEHRRVRLPPERGMPRSSIRAVRRTPSAGLAD